jgi:hypothetical protein
MNNYIISLGPFCITKTAINQIGFYSKTMPFDWMFSSLNFIKNVIMDDFNNLLNIDYICSTNPCWSKNKSYNTLYNDNILKSKNITTHLLSKEEYADYDNFHMWSHYNLLEEENYNKYVKYVERFKNVIHSRDKKIFLYIQYYDESLLDVFDFNEYLNNTIINYKLICIHCKKVSEKNNETIILSYDKNDLLIYNIEIEKYSDTLEDKYLEHLKKIIDAFI